jgi:hypothetical protein
MVLFRPNYKLLFNRGLATSEIDNLMGNIKINGVVDYLYELYTCINGPNYSINGKMGEIMMFEGFIPYSIEAAIREKENNKFIPKDMFPVFTDQYGGYILIKGFDEKIYYLSIEYPEMPNGIVIFDDMYSMILSLYEAFKKGMYFFNSSGQFEEIEDWALIKRHFKSWNPKSQYWDFMDEED